MGIDTLGIGSSNSYANRLGILKIPYGEIANSKNSVWENSRLVKNPLKKFRTLDDLFRKNLSCMTNFWHKICLAKSVPQNFRIVPKCPCQNGRWSKSVYKICHLYKKYTTKNLPGRRENPGKIEKSPLRF